MIITPTGISTSTGKQVIQTLLNRLQDADTGCRDIVGEILAEVRKRGDEALLEYTRKFDAKEFQASQLKVTGEEFEAAYELVDGSFRETLSITI
ncbi:MAG: histidinol dehydrogenase, partial [Proteobacteria bacterium]|nr:histidinol dehydrogenase [Pseudomonadota bacterium]